MEPISLRTRVTRRDDELVIAIPDHLHTHIREGDEVTVPLPRPEPEVRRARRSCRPRSR